MKAKENTKAHARVKGFFQNHEPKQTLNFKPPEEDLQEMLDTTEWYDEELQAKD